MVLRLFTSLLIYISEGKNVGKRIACLKRYWKGQAKICAEKAGVGNRIWPDVRGIPCRVRGRSRSAKTKEAA